MNLHLGLRKALLCGDCTPNAKYRMGSSKEPSLCFIGLFTSARSIKVCENSRPWVSVG